MEIKNCTIDDIDEIFRLYKIASEYQRTKKKVVVWPNFERSMVVKEIDENRQWKMISNGEIVCLWAITFHDEQIWEEKDNDSSIYIHRIATNPNYRGNNYVSKIVDWSLDYAESNNKRYVRLDTLGNNIKLIAHYKKAGFDFLGMFDLKNTNKLPEHYQNERACLFEIDLEKQMKNLSY